MSHEDFLWEVAATAGGIMRVHWSPAGVAFELKCDRTPVTLADQQIGKFIAARFAETYPGRTCIREETDFPKRTGNDIEGLFDEIDGTAEYARGGCQAVFAGAIMMDHRVEWVIIHAPLLDIPLTFVASFGSGAFCNEAPIKVSKETEGALRIVVATANRRDERYDAPALIAELTAAGFIVETMQSSSYSCAQLARGRVHGVIFPWDTIHDMGMGHLVVTEADGCTSDLNGKPLDFGKNKLPGYIMANTPRVHSRLFEIVSRHRREPEV